MDHLVIVTDAWIPQVNGVVRTLTTTVDILRSRGWKVTVIEPSMFSTIPSGYPGIRLARPPYHMEERIRSLMPATAVHISTEGPLGWEARSVFKRMGFPFTSAYHTSFPLIMSRYWIPDRLTYAVLRRFHKNSDCVMVPTRSIRDMLVTRRFQNVSVWGRGVDHRVFHPMTEKLNFEGPCWLSVGRVSAEKNLDAFLSLDLPGTKVVVGDGPDLERLRKTYPTAQFLGEMRGEALAKVYAGSDVFVFPSKFDTFGLVMAEAIASGTPVAAFPVMGPIDVIKYGRSGIMNDDLRQACLDCLDLDRGIVAESGASFSWEAATNQFVESLSRIGLNKS